MRRQCLQLALDNHDDFGIFGGMTARERRMYRKRHGDTVTVLPPVSTPPLVVLGRVLSFPKRKGAA